MNSTTVLDDRSEFQRSYGITIGKMGIWWFLASEIMVFGGLIGCYILFRMASSGAWTEMESHVSTPIGTLNTIVLLTSSLTMVLAHASVQAQDQKKTRNYLGLTVLLGLVFLCIKSMEYALKIQAGFTPATGTFWGFYYIMTGLHGLHVLAGLVANLYLFISAARGTLWKGLQGRVEYAGLYWHFVDIVWIFLFPLIYLRY